MILAINGSSPDHDELAKSRLERLEELVASEAIDLVSLLQSREGTFEERLMEDALAQVPWLLTLLRAEVKAESDFQPDGEKDQLESFIRPLLRICLRACGVRFSKDQPLDAVSLAGFAQPDNVMMKLVAILQNVADPCDINLETADMVPLVVTDPNGVQGSAQLACAINQVLAIDNVNDACWTAKAEVNGYPRLHRRTFEDVTSTISVPITFDGTSLGGLCIEWRSEPGTDSSSARALFASPATIETLRRAGQIAGLLYKASTSSRARYLEQLISILKHDTKGAAFAEINVLAASLLEGAQRGAQGGSAVVSISELKKLHLLSEYVASAWVILGAYARSRAKNSEEFFASAISNLVRSTQFICLHDLINRAIDTVNAALFGDGRLLMKFENSCSKALEVPISEGAGTLVFFNLLHNCFKYRHDAGDELDWLKDNPSESGGFEFQDEVHTPWSKWPVTISAEADATSCIITIRDYNVWMGDEIADAFGRQNMAEVIAAERNKRVDRSSDKLRTKLAERSSTGLGVFFTAELLRKAGGKLLRPQRPSEVCDRRFPNRPCKHIGNIVQIMLPIKGELT